MEYVREKKQHQKKATDQTFVRTKFREKHEKWNQKAVFIARNNNNTKNTISLKQNEKSR